MPSASVSPKPQRPRTSSSLHDGAAPLASDLQIAGLVPLSTVDWPGKLSATVFCQGCPWNCEYCHNPSLIDCAMPGIVEWNDVTSLLERRRGLLDAVVFTGGEATRQAALVPAMEEVRDAGFLVGLHTAGAYPTRMRKLALLVDWVGLDIKALPGDYGQVAGAISGGRKAWECLDILISAGVNTEVRLTVYPGSAPARTALQIAHEVRRRGATTFALQNARTEGTREEFAARSREGWNATWERLCTDMLEVGFPELRCR
ncbi:MAG: anaerobic ribonucleoside-triphosphate reductase activating protein [Ruaniaceae bacterium]|nr:anaerobic ribonucleoside-triphosphate reductase activating protein [Ruaniaceae bacterium]